MRLRQFTGFNPLLIPYPMESSYPPLPSLLAPNTLPLLLACEQAFCLGKGWKNHEEVKERVRAYFREIKYLFKTFFKFNWCFGECFPPFCYNTLICIHPLSRTVFLYRILKNKANRTASSAWWPLNRGENNGTTLVEEAKRWQRLLNSGGRSIEV